jgi:hypothetical protein
MATYKVLYWQEIPSQVKAEDMQEEVNLELAARFMDRIDRAAQERGLHGSDDYLAQWHWGDDQERDGTAQEVAQAVKAELERESGV